MIITPPAADAALLVQLVSVLDQNKNSSGFILVLMKAQILKFKRQELFFFFKSESDAKKKKKKSWTLPLRSTASFFNVLYINESVRRRNGKRRMDLEGERCEKEAASLLTPLRARLHLYRRRRVKAGGEERSRRRSKQTLTWRKK